MTLASLEATWCVTLGQPATDFWASTPKRVDAFLVAAEDNERRLDNRAGVIAAAIVNVNRKKGTRALKPEDFFKRAEAPKRYMSDGELRSAFLGFAKAQKN